MKRAWGGTIREWDGGIPDPGGGAENKSAESNNGKRSSGSGVLRGGHPVPEPLTPSPKKRSVGAQDPKCTYARSWGARSAATPCQRRRGGRDARSSAGDRWTIPTRSRRRGGGGDTRVVTSYISCANEANAPHEDLSENSESCDARMPEPTVDGSPPYAYGPRGSKLRGRARPTPPLLT